MNTRYYLKVPIRIASPGIQPSPFLPEDAVKMGLDCNIILIPAGTEIMPGAYRKKDNGLYVKVRVPGEDQPFLVLIGWLFLIVKSEN